MQKIKLNLKINSFFGLLPEAYKPFDPIVDIANTNEIHNRE